MDKRKRYRRKMLTILSVLILLTAIFTIYRIKIFRWSCNREEVAPSCVLVGQNYQKRGELELAREYLHRACELEYALGCKYLGDFYSEQKDLSHAQEYWRIACSLGLETCCQ